MSTVPLLRVTPVGSGTAVLSNTVVVENTPPTLSGVTLGPSTATETTTLTCAPVQPMMMMEIL